MQGTKTRTSLFAPTRDRLLIGAWFSAACIAILQAARVLAWGWHGDASIYWSVWDNEQLYDTAPGVPGGFMYPPVFAQVLWPLTLLPWPVFHWAWFAGAVATYWWLLRPLRWVWAVPLAALAIDDVRTGNIIWLMALAGVLGLRHATWWLVPALIKVTTAAGAFWYAGRGDWRALVRVALVGLAIVATSAVTAPALWAEWLAFMQGNGSPFLVLRTAVALGLAVWAGRSGRAWLIPFTMLLASPVLGLWPFGFLCALPRTLPADALAAANRRFGGASATTRRVLALASPSS